MHEGPCPPFCPLCAEETQTRRQRKQTMSDPCPTSIDALPRGAVPGPTPAPPRRPTARTGAPTLDAHLIGLLTLTRGVHRPLYRASAAERGSETPGRCSPESPEQLRPSRRRSQPASVTRCRERSPSPSSWSCRSVATPAGCSRVELRARRGPPGDNNPTYREFHKEFRRVLRLHRKDKCT